MSAFAPLPFSLTSPFLPDASTMSAFPSFGPPFSPVHTRYSPPPQSLFSPTLASLYPALAVHPSAAAVAICRTGTGAARAGADAALADAHVQVLAEHTMPCALSALTVGIARAGPARGSASRS
ncbi:hypothetical protein DFH08DRAFT_807586 [Mycena albidolilacea]|uniref:Uncharacterized protein n=1 Tax=Mycena albidolilacea TaxID=1033008 RepID=A0AAD7ERX5_9AGAR|nr:hypothetical protein DFH08DRAFT_807586 [Mycena albidolilacea]